MNVEEDIQFRTCNSARQEPTHPNTATRSLGLMAAPFYLATPENGWIDLVQPNLSPWLFPKNDLSVRHDPPPPITPYSASNAAQKQIPISNWDSHRASSRARIPGPIAPFALLDSHRSEA